MVSKQDFFKVATKNSLEWIKGGQLAQAEAGGAIQFDVAQSLLELKPYGNFGHHYLQFVVVDGETVPFWVEDSASFKPNIVAIFDTATKSQVASLNDLVDWDGNNFPAWMSSNGLCLRTH